MEYAEAIPAGSENFVHGNTIGGLMKSGAFVASAIRRVMLPEGLKTIGKLAFEEC